MKPLDPVRAGLDRVAPEATDRARRAKHRLHRWWWMEKIQRKKQAMLAYRAVRPFHYDPDRFYNTFLAYETPPTDPQPEVPRRIWCAWTGDNPLSANRARGLDSIRAANPDAEVTLVTPDNLAEFVPPDAPLHPIYPSLSLVHRSDYLRCYLLHHYGGAYADIKTQRGCLTDAIDLLNERPELWLVASPQVWMAPPMDSEPWLLRECRRNFAVLPTGGAYAVRAGTALTAEWYAELHRRADYFLDLAQAHHGEIWGLTYKNTLGTKYPIQWNELLGNILEPLCLKYQEHLLLDERFRPDLVDHR